MKRPLAHMRYPRPMVNTLGEPFDYDIVNNNDNSDMDLTRHDPPRTKQRHPYAYDPFTIWGEPCPNEKCNGTAYTDRLNEFDQAKYEQLARKHYRSGDTCWERPFDTYRCQGNLIEAFLRDWFDDPELKLMRVIEYCNPGTGDPTWRCDYISKATK